VTQQQGRLTGPRVLPVAPGLAPGVAFCGAAAEPKHFQEKWNPVFRPKMRRGKKLEHIKFLLKLNVL
jgi:hypothetical protein